MAEQLSNVSEIVAKLERSAKRIATVQRELSAKQALGGDTETAVTVQSSAPQPPRSFTTPTPGKG